MSRPFLLTYQLLLGAADSVTGLLLIFAPVLTTHLMRLHVPPEGLPLLSFVGAFVFSVGIAYLYGAALVAGSAKQKLEAVWLVTAITRGSVSVFVTVKVVTGAYEPGWATVAVSDAACTVIQAIGLYRGWLANAAH